MPLAHALSIYVSGNVWQVDPVKWIKRFWLSYPNCKRKGYIYTYLSISTMVRKKERSDREFEAEPKLRQTEVTGGQRHVRLSAFSQTKTPTHIPPIFALVISDRHQEIRYRGHLLVVRNSVYPIYALGSRLVHICFWQRLAG